MTASTLNFLSLVFVQFVNIKTQFYSSTLFKDESFQCISWCGTEGNFPSNKRGKNVLGTRILCCQCFFFNTNTTCIQVCPLPGRKRRDPEFWPFDGQAWWKETAATAWEICSGKSASQLCPSNHQISMWLIVWWGSRNHQASFSFLFWDCVLEPFPLATTGSFLRDGTKMQHALPVWCMFSPWQIFTKMKLLYLKGGWEVRRSVWVWRKGNAASFSWAAGALALASLLTRLPAWRAGRKRRALPSFPIGSSNEDKCLGIFFFSTM